MNELEKIMKLDRECRQEIMEKIKKKKELNQFELQYIILCMKTINEYKKRKRK